MDGWTHGCVDGRRYGLLASWMQPTRVLLLKNMMGAGEGAEEDVELPAEVAAESGKYGPVKTCVVQELPPDRPEHLLQGETELPEDEVGR